MPSYTYPRACSKLKCVPLYIHSTQCFSHVPRLLTQVHIIINYFLQFRSNNFNSFTSKLPKNASSQEVRQDWNFRIFRNNFINFRQTLSSPLSKNSTLNSQFLLKYLAFVTENLLAAWTHVVSEDLSFYMYMQTHRCAFINSLCFSLTESFLDQTKRVLH